MKRWWLITALGATSALVVLHLTRERTEPAPAPAQAAAGTTEAQPQPDVTVEHLLVTAERVSSLPTRDEAEASPRSTRRMVATSGVTRRTTAEPAARPLPDTDTIAATSPPLLERARRAFLGDGRHRPQPFPRVKDN